MPHQSRAQRRRQPVRSAQSQTRQAVVPNMLSQPQRRVVRPALEPVDYTREYASVRRDLWRITIWTVLLFIGMGVVYFVI